MNRVLRRKQLLELIGLSGTTQWRLEKAGDFPARVKLGSGSVGWLVDRGRGVAEEAGKGTEAKPYAYPYVEPIAAHRWL